MTTRNSDVSDRGWSGRVHRGDSPSFMGRMLGFWFTTANKPSDDMWRKLNSRAGRMLTMIQGPSVGNGRIIAAWPGYLVLTTDGRAIYISAFDFFNDKPATSGKIFIEPRHGHWPGEWLSGNFRYWGDFTCRLMVSPLVAQIEDLPMVPPAGAIRAYSEGDVFLLLENPEIDFVELGTIAERVQQVNALRAQISQLETKRVQLEAHLTQIATQKVKTGFETAEAAHARSATEQQLQEVLARELALQEQLTAAHQLAAAQAMQVGAEKNPWLWVAAAAGGAALLWFLWRKP